MSHGSEMQVFRSREDLAVAAATEFRSRATDAIANHGSFRVALGGDDLTRLVYRELSREPDALPWDQVHFCLTDDLAGPAEHPDNVFRVAYDELLWRIRVRPGNVFRFFCEGEDDEFAASYADDMLRDIYKLGPDDRPRFDLVLLRVGAQGQVAGLYPGSPLLRERRRLSGLSHAGPDGRCHFTLTPAALCGGRAVRFLAAGRDAAAAVRAARQASGPDESHPATLLQPDDGEVVWLLDEQAAGR